MKNLLQRTVSGIIYLIIIVGSLLLGKFVFGSVLLLICILALVEFYDLTGISGTALNTILSVVGASGMIILSFLVTSRMVKPDFLVLALVLPLVLLAVTLYMPKSDLVRDLSVIILGIVYVVVPLASMNYLVFPASNGNVYTYRIVLGILVLVWINDTGAYLTGSLWGRHKLFPRISPKKSWEGLIGGTLLTLIAALWMEYFMGILSRTDWITLGMIVSVFGVYGDLTESLIKRNADRKDSGNIMPGHGGVLDRFDSILFVMPAALIYLMCKGL